MKSERRGMEHRQRPRPIPSSTFLSDRNREIYRLRVEERVSAEEIAKRFGIGASRVQCIIAKMKNVLKEIERIKNPMTEADYIESLFYPNSLILNALRDEEVNTIEDLRRLIDKIDSSKYGLPKIGERSLNTIRRVLAEAESKYLGKKK